MPYLLTECFEFLYIYRVVMEYRYICLLLSVLYCLVVLALYRYFHLYISFINLNVCYVIMLLTKLTIVVLLLNC